MTQTHTLIDHLVPSPLNVRTNDEDKADIKQLAASIEAHGLLQPLVVVENGDTYEVVAGNRRLAALQSLEWGEPVPVTVIDAEGAVEASLAENLVRKAMRPYELYEAIASLTLSQKAIAARFGLPIQTVREAQRLGRLHPDIMAAYKAGEIDDEIAQAYAATADTDRQKAAFDEMQGEGYHPTWRIRRTLGFGDYDQRRKLEDVGEAYEAAGGKYETDLFGESKRPLDEGLLDRLYAEHLEARGRKLAETFGAKIVDELPANAFRCWRDTPDEGQTYVVWGDSVYWLDERDNTVAETSEDGDQPEPEPEGVQLTQKACSYMEEARRDRFFNTVLGEADDAVLFLLFSLTHDLKEQQSGYGWPKPDDELADFDTYVANGNHQADACRLLLGRYTGKAVEGGAFSGWAARQPQLKWASTEEFWSLFRKGQILEMLEPVAPTFATTYANAKQGEVRTKAHALCTGQEILAIPKEEREAAQAWVPSWLRFESVDQPAKLEEAA